MKKLTSLALASLLVSSSLTAFAFEADIPEASSEKALGNTAAVLAEDPVSAEAPVAYNEAYGFLVWFDNFSGTAYEGNIADISVPANTYAEKEVFDGCTTLKCGQSKLSPQTVGVEFIPNGDGWAYTNGKPISGTMYLYEQCYVDYDSAPGRFTVIVSDSAAAGWDGWGAYKTNWTCTGKPAAKTWSNTYSTGVNPAVVSRFGILSDNWRNEHVRALGLYVKPNNAFVLADLEGNYELIFPEGDTYELPDTYDAYACGSSIYYAGEEVNAADLLGKLVSPFEVYEQPDVYSESLGMLIYFDNLIDTPYSVLDSSVISGLGAIRTVIDGKFAASGTGNFCGGTSGVGLISSSPFTYGNGKPVSGTVTIVGEIIETGGKLYGASFIEAEGLNGWDNWSPFFNPDTGSATNTPLADRWCSFKAATSRANIKKLSVCECGSSVPYYTHGFAVYVKPDNAFFLADLDGNVEMIFPEGDTYTVPGTYTNWMYGSTMCNNGDVIPVSDLLGKTLTPYAVAEAPEAESEEYGKLIYFNNFSGSSDFTNLIDLTVKGASAPSVYKQKYGVYGKNTFFDMVFTHNDCSGIELVQSDGNGGYQDWVFTDGTTAAGTFQIVAELAFTNAKNTVYNMFYNGTDEYGASWDAGFPLVTTDWSGPFATTDFSVWTPKTNPTNVSCINHWGIGYIGNSEKLFFHSIAVYYKPKDADQGAPLSFDVSSVRTSDNTGLRLAAYVDDAQRETADEYGFIIAKAEALEGDVNKLAFNAARDEKGVNEAGVKYTSGVNYVKEGIDLVYSTDGAFLGKPDKTGTFFTGVLINIPESAYKMEFAARPYLVKDGVTLYGKTVTRSLYSAAKAVADGGYTGLDDDAKTFIDSIILASES